MYEPRGNYWGFLSDTSEQGGWCGFVAYSRGAVFCDVFLRARFNFCEGYGRCAVAVDPLELFLVFEMLGSILYRYNVYLVSLLQCSNLVEWKKYE